MSDRAAVSKPGDAVAGKDEHAQEEAAGQDENRAGAGEDEDGDEHAETDYCQPQLCPTMYSIPP